ncbi:MAG: hemolysin family protein [Gemmatimonadota bacterium]
MDFSFLWKLLAVLLLVGANAFFVSAEFALVAVRRTRIHELVAGGDRLARTVEKALRNLDRSISGTQLGITLASLGLGWIGEPAVAETLEGLFAGLPGALAPLTTHAAAITIAFAIITYLHIVLGELAPKTVALVAPEKVSRYVAGPLIAFNWVMQPGVWLLNGSSNLFLRLLGMRPVRVPERVHSPHEIQMLVQESLREGEVEADEEAMIHGVFRMTHTAAREVMTPRTDIVGIPSTATLEEVVGLAAESGFSRFPVYEESLDNVLGVLLIKDVIPRLAAAEGREVTAGELAREAIFVPDTKRVDDLLAQLRRQKVHMAIVVDEFGGTDGIVTLEDLVEEIVGDIYDEHDVAAPELVVQPDGTVVVDGGFSFDDLRHEFELPAAEEEYDTVAGYVIGQLGRIPEEGESVSLGGAELRVVGIQDRRVTRVRVRLAAGEQEDSQPVEDRE